ncbi:hypothetical protein [Peterkaempfera bronchialis]|uniref:Integral membrane protein n=1 Tax=Peterkaempfera bronchialis TaxID=2126346 RepID=A0A345SW49_9ACTN|nr:hypothetical protein [Peterkaempfera bronchialis]AXI77954.1 hypothetical protein C7M71_011405 [Peterkaempfera bronchialis]
MSSGNSTGERDPFAPPPADAPDRPWQPRAPQPPAGGPQGTQSPGDGGRPDDGSPQGRPPVPPPHPWSPGWQGRPPGSPYPPGGPQQRYDPTDPVQRRARYALLAGMWGLFFMIFSLPYVGLLLGALALYWGISALRGTAKDPAAAAGQSEPQQQQQQRIGQTAPPPPAGQRPVPLPPPGWAHSRPPRPQVPAALGGLVTGGVALAMVAASWAVQLTHKDYYDCVSDALTQKAEHSCSTLIPDWLQKYNGVGS